MSTHRPTPTGTIGPPPGRSMWSKIDTELCCPECAGEDVRGSTVAGAGIIELECAACDAVWYRTPLL